jgi:CBS domain-containing protein
MRHSVRDLASKNLIAVHWLDSLDRAYALMTTRGIRHLPVSDDDGNIVGLISDRDFQRAMQIDQPQFASGYVAQPTFDQNTAVRDFMSWPVEAISETASVGDAAKLMIDKKISALLVTRGQAVAGILTTEDLLRALLSSTEGKAQRAIESLESAFVRSPVGPIAASLGNAGI